MPSLVSKVVPKLWGTETWIVNEDAYCGKLLILQPGFQCSLHYHPIKDETFYVLSGVVKLEVREPDQSYETLYLYPGTSYRLRPGTPHRFSACEDRAAQVMEFSTHHSDGDVVRLEESRKVT